MRLLAHELRHAAIDLAGQRDEARVEVVLACLHSRNADRAECNVTSDRIERHDCRTLSVNARRAQLQHALHRAGGEINRRMPEFVREKTHRILNMLGVSPSKSKILLLGVSYKRDLGDWRESPALEVISYCRMMRRGRLSTIRMSSASRNTAT